MSEVPGIFRKCPKAVNEYACQKWETRPLLRGNLENPFTDGAEMHRCLLAALAPGC